MHSVLTQAFELPLLSSTVPRTAKSPHVATLRGGPGGPRPSAEDDRRQKDVYQQRPGGAQFLPTAQRIRRGGHLLPEQHSLASGRCPWAGCDSSLAGTTLPFPAGWFRAG